MKHIALTPEEEDVLLRILRIEVAQSNNEARIRMLLTILRKMALAELQT